MHLSISKNAPSVIAMTLAILISPAQAQTSSTTCTSTSPQCCWVKRSWELMGKTTSVSATHATACCNYLGSTTQTSGIPGVTCTSTGIVTEIHWNFYSLQGSIPSSLGNLVNLQELYLGDNQLNGTIPTSLGNLVNLQELNLGINQFSGTIPSSLGNLVNLQRLYLNSNPGLDGTFTPRCRTISGVIPYFYISGTGVTICGCAAASNPPTLFPPAGTSAACLASGPAFTLSKRILVFQVIGSFQYTCNTDFYNNPYADCLNTMAKICNTADPTWDSTKKANCHTGVNMMFGNMNSHWQKVRKECGRWSWTQNGQTFVRNSTSGNCATANADLRTNAFYIHRGVQVRVDSGLTESINVGLWSNALLAP